MDAEPNPKVSDARSRYSAALSRMMSLANASAANPALDADYTAAVADVAAAEAEMKGLVR